PRSLRARRRARGVGTRARRPLRRAVDPALVVPRLRALHGRGRLGRPARRGRARVARLDALVAAEQAARGRLGAGEVDAFLACEILEPLLPPRDGRGLPARAGTGEAVGTPEHAPGAELAPRVAQEVAHSVLVVLERAVPHRHVEEGAVVTRRDLDRVATPQR